MEEVDLREQIFLAWVSISYEQAPKSHLVCSGAGPGVRQVPPFTMAQTPLSWGPAQANSSSPCRCTKSRLSPYPNQKILDMVKIARLSG